MNKLERGPHSSSDWYSYRSAKELRAVGVHFKPGKTHLYTDVTFKPSFLSGKLTIPPITVDDSTKSMLLNLIAYETCPNAPDDFGVTSYICFMDSIIDHAEDVMVLRSKGILLNFLGSDQEVVDLFNAIARIWCPILMLMLMLRGALKNIIGINSRYGWRSGYIRIFVALGPFSHSLQQVLPFSLVLCRLTTHQTHPKDEKGNHGILLSMYHWGNVSLSGFFVCICPFFLTRSTQLSFNNQ